MHKMNADMQACIEACLDCYQACFGAAMNHCLDTGGKHVEPKHFRLMMACSDLPDIGAFHADEFRPRQARLPRVRRNLHAMRGGLRTHGRHGRLRQGLPPMRCKLHENGGVNFKIPPRPVAGF